MKRLRLTAALALLALFVPSFRASAQEQGGERTLEKVQALKEAYMPAASQRKATHNAPPISSLQKKIFSQWDDLGGNNPRQLYDASCRISFRGDSCYIDNFFNEGFTAAGYYNATNNTVQFHPQKAFYLKPYGDFYLMPFNVTRGGFYSDPKAYFELTITDEGHLHLSDSLGWVIVVADETSSFYGSAIGVSRNLRFKKTNATMAGEKRIVSSKKFEDASYRVYLEQPANSELLIANFCDNGRSVIAQLNPDKTWVMEPQVLVENSLGGPSCNFNATWTSSQNKGVAGNMTGSATDTTMNFSPWGVFRANALLQCSFGMNTCQITLDEGSTIKWPTAQEHNLQGEGTQENPYKISSVEDLNTLALLVNGGNKFTGKYFQQTQDIDFGNTVTQYRVIGSKKTPFDGIYDGNNKKISNLNISRGATQYTGLFGYAGANSVLKNLTLNNAKLTTAEKYAGVLVGSTQGPIENVHVTARISASTEYIGGLAGQGCKITNSSFIGTLSGAAYTGGLVGEERQDTISNCHVSAVITTGLPNSIGHGVGGVAGCLSASSTKHGVISDTYFLGSMTDNTGYAWQGGIAGNTNNNSVIERCMAAGIMSTAVTKSTIGSCGGLVGNCSGAIRDSYTTMSIQASKDNTKTGGIVGALSLGKWLQPQLQNCISTAQVRCGGIPTPAQAIYGNTSATSGQYAELSNVFVDRQMSGMDEADGGRLSSFLTSGTPIEGFSTDIWKFSAGHYPVLKNFPEKVMAFAAAPVLLHGEEQLSYVRSDFNIGLDPALQWSIYNGSKYVQESEALKIEGNQVKLKGQLAQELLAVTLNDLSLGGTFSRIYFLNIAPKQFEGDGTAQSPYLLKSPADFKTLNKAITENGLTFENDYYALANDIDFSGVTDFYGIADDTNEKHLFNATLDGRGHSIKNWYLNGYTITPEGKIASGAKQTVALIGILGTKGHVKNLIIDSSCKLNGAAGVASTVAICNGTIENVRNYAPVTAASTHAAGIVARLMEGAKVLNCYNAGTITCGDTYSAGLVAEMKEGSALLNSQNDGLVHADSLVTIPFIKTAAAAGLVGNTGGKVLIANCVNQGNVKAGTEVAGIVARMADGTQLRNVINTGILHMGDSKSETGGIAATNRNIVAAKNTYYDAQLIFQGAVGKAPYSGVKGLNSSELLAGTVLEGLSTDTFDFSAGQLPVLKLFKDETATKALRSMYITLTAPEVSNEINSPATLTSAQGLTWKLDGKGFTINGTTLQPQSTPKPAQALLTATLGNFSREFELQRTHVPFSGAGTQQDPYKLNTYNDWKLLSQYTNRYGLRYSGKYFAMNNDVDCDSTDNFMPVAYNSANHFMGNIDGQNHTLKHIRIEYTDKNGDLPYENAGVIGTLGREGSISNMRINGRIRAYKYVGGLVGISYGNIDNCHNDGYVGSTNNTNTAGLICSAYAGKITNCTNRGQVIGNYNTVGGILSYGGLTVTVENCHNYGVVMAKDSVGDRYYGTVGGIVGNMSGTIRNCTNRGTVKGASWVGGVVGDGNYVDSCFNYSEININGSMVGGVAGRINGSITHCRNYAEVFGTNYTGGVVGDLSSNAKGSYLANYAKVHGTSKSYTGGVAGDLSSGSVLDSCANYAEVLGEGTNSGYVGGVTGGGTSNITLSRLVNYAPVTVTGGDKTYYVGGIAGACGGFINDCYNYGEVTNKSYGTGGIAGHGNGRANRCVNLGNVSTSYTGTSKYGNAGGIWGNSAINIYDCINYGNVTGSHYTGGILGYSTGSTKIARVYFSGTLTGVDEATTGAIVHVDASQSKVTVDSAYYNTDLAKGFPTNDADAARAIGLSSMNLTRALLGKAFDYHQNSLPTLKVFAANPDLNAASNILIFKDGENAESLRSSCRIERFDGVDVTVSPNLKIEGNKIYVVATKAKDPATITIKAPNYTRVYTVITDNGGNVVDGLDGAKTPASVRYFSLDGIEIANPAAGSTVIRITLYTDGTAATEKVIIR